MTYRSPPRTKICRGNPPWLPKGGHRGPPLHPMGLFSEQEHTKPGRLHIVQCSTKISYEPFITCQNVFHIRQL